MKRSSFFNKVFGGFLVLLTAFGVIVLVSFLGTAQHSAMQELSANLQNLAWTTAVFIEDKKLFSDTRRLETLVVESGKKTGSRFTVIDKNGKVLADSDDDPAKMENHRFRQEVEAALRGEIGKSYRFSKTMQRKMLYVAVPLKEGSDVIGLVRTSMYADSIHYLFLALLRQVILAGIIMIVAAWTAAFILTKQLTGPLEDIVEAVNKMANGDMNARVRLKTNSLDFETLTNGFNDMAARTGGLIMELSHEREELQGIISSMNEGLVLLDFENRITNMNRSFQTMAGRDDIKGKPLWEIIREPDVFKLVENIKNLEQSKTLELLLQGRNYLCGISPLKTRKETLLVFHDITELKRMERIKKEFVDNVSHELRTPLTAIKGFSETLLSEEKSPEKKHYLEIIQRHTDRLVSIVQDLLVLAELEEKRGQAIRREKFDMRELVEKTALLFESRMKEKELVFIPPAGKGVVEAFADPFKIEQVLINLMDNAVKYTEKGSIGVELIPEVEGLTIIIKDSGQGIDPKDLSRIFERFYVADKSRSKQNSGTGLGLAIVQQIIGLHGGDIKVESKIGMGTQFVISLPKI